MALPYDGESEFGRQGAYQLTEQDEEVRPISVNKRNSMTTYNFDQHPPPANEEEEERQLPKNPIFTGCLGQVPSVILVLLAILIVLFVVFSIPLVFVFTQAYHQQPLPMDDKTDASWPIEDDYGNQNDSIASVLALLPKNVTMCGTSMGFLCVNRPSIVIGTNSLCDGIADCPDGSDEADCKDCKTSFSCFQSPNSTNSSKLCLRAKSLFDGQFHCADESDENVHEQQNQGKCPSDKFKCSKSCIPKTFMCDGERHCPDGEDEKNCEGKCQNGSKYCKSLNQCLPKWTLCNGIKDCDDGTDEDDCDCKQCSGHGKMLCKSSPGEKGFCLNGNRICDGRRDCPNGEDEDGCPGEVKMDEIEMVKCKDGKSYSKVYACLGLIPSCEDCDECKKNCSKEIQFKCKNEDKYISQTARCDGRKHCSDGSDEEECSANDCGIHPYPMYLCEDGKHCFRKNEVCTPYSICPVPSSVDKGYCSVFRKSSFLL